MGIINENKEYSSRADIMKDYQQAVDERQIAFTTFHQSMDYEEFVEGLKPVLTDDGEINYEVLPGIFKTICQNAEQNVIIELPEVELTEQIIEYVTINPDRIYEQSGAGQPFVLRYQVGTGNTNIEFKLESSSQWKQIIVLI